MGDSATQAIDFVGNTFSGASDAISSGAQSLGIGAETSGAIGSGVVDAALGAAAGAGLGALGGNPGLGALAGGVAGGAFGASGGNDLFKAAPATPAAIPATAGGPAASAGAMTAPGDTGGAGLDPFAKANLDAAGANPAQSALNALPAPQNIDQVLNRVAGTAAPATGATGGAAAAPAAAKGLFGTNITGKDLLGPAVTAGALGFGAANQPKLPDPSAIIAGQNTRADQLAAQGKQLIDPLITGVLPQGAQRALDQATQSAKATVRSNFASMGLSGSSMEADALAKVDTAAAGQAYQTALSMAQAGLNLANTGNAVYDKIVAEALQQDQNMQKAVANFAASIGGGASPARLANTAMAG